MFYSSFAFYIIYYEENIDTSGNFLCVSALKFKIITENTDKKRPPASAFFCFTGILIHLGSE